MMTSLNQEEYKKAITILESHLLKQGLNESSVGLCLDAVKLATTWYVKPSSLEELKQGQAFVAYSFGIGKRKDGQKEIQDPSKVQYNSGTYFPGKTNEDLAKVIAELQEKGLERPIFAQWEVATALIENHKINLPEKNIAKPREGYLSSLGVIKQFLEAGLEDYDRIILVAHPIHVRRAKATTEIEIEKQRGKALEKILIPDISKVRFDLESIQPWTRDESSNIRWDIGSRIRQVFYLQTLRANHITE